MWTRIACPRYEEGTKGKPDWIQDEGAGTKKTRSKGRRNSKEPIKTLASGKLPGIEVSLACIQNLKFLPNL